MPHHDKPNGDTAPRNGGHGVAMTFPMTRDPAEIAGLIARHEAAGFHHTVPLLRAAMHGDINAIFLTRGVGQPPIRRMERIGRPLVVMIGDDDYRPSGPNGWAAADRLARWARGAIVHGAGGKAEHYAEAVTIAARVRRLLFIETTTASTMGWITFIQARQPGLPVVVHVATDGPHPVAPSRAGGCIERDHEFRLRTDHGSRGRGSARHPERCAFRR